MTKNNLYDEMALVGLAIVYDINDVSQNQSIHGRAQLNTFVKE